MLDKILNDSMAKDSTINVCWLVNVIGLDVSTSSHSCCQFQSTTIHCTEIRSITRIYLNGACATDDGNTKPTTSRVGICL